MKNKALTVLLVLACVLVFSDSCSHKEVEEETIYEIIKMERMVQ